MKKLCYAMIIAASALACPATAIAADAAAGSSSEEPKSLAISIFLAFVVLTLGITYFASRRTKDANDFYAAGGDLTGFQNGLAIAGDWMSAATFLGMSGLVFVYGVDGIVYAVGAAISWPIVMFVLADRVRNLGKYTYVDVVAYRLRSSPIRILFSFSGLVIIFLYMIAQMVGAGALIQLLFGLPYYYAVILVGILMTIYVSIGGMLATSWIQITKAVILLFGGTILAFLVLQSFGFSIDTMFTQAAEESPRGAAILNAGNLLEDPISAIGLALAFLFGPAGLPHILMRFFTVPDGAAARSSVSYAMLFIGYFQIVVFLIGLGSISLLANNPAYFDATNSLIGGSNMAALHVSELLGGELLFGIVSAVTFATILAVVAGLTLSAASTFSHDLYAAVFAKGNANEKTEVAISRFSTLAIGLIAIGLGLLFEKQNVAYMATLSLSVAASVNFVLLALSLYWSGLTTRGAVIGGSAGLFTAIFLVILSKPIWVDILGNADPIYPYAHPTVFSMAVTITLSVVISMRDKSPSAEQERKAFESQEVISEFGIDAAGK